METTNDEQNCQRNILGNILRHTGGFLHQDIPAAAQIGGRLVVRIGREQWTDVGRGDRRDEWKRRMIEKKIVSVMY